MINRRIPLKDSQKVQKSQPRAPKKSKKRVNNNYECVSFTDYKILDLTVKPGARLVIFFSTWHKTAVPSVNRMELQSRNSVTLEAWWCAKLSTSSPFGYSVVSSFPRARRGVDSPSCMPCFTCVSKAKPPTDTPTSSVDTSVPSESFVRREARDVFPAPLTPFESKFGEAIASPRPHLFDSTELPPFVAANSDVERRLSVGMGGVAPTPVWFTNEVTDKKGLRNWKSSALAVSVSTLKSTRGRLNGISTRGRLNGNPLKGASSRIAGMIERQLELERGRDNDIYDTYDGSILGSIRDESEVLERRLNKMNLETVQMEDDGNCQFRALSFNLFGTPDHHQVGTTHENPFPPLKPSSRLAHFLAFKISCPVSGCPFSVTLSATLAKTRATIAIER